LEARVGIEPSGKQASARAVPPAPPAAAPAQMLGRYKLLEKLGEGGGQLCGSGVAARRCGIYGAMSYSVTQEVL